LGVTIRDARFEDSAAIADLLGQLGYPTTVEAVEARLARLARVGDKVVVADLDGSIVGLASLRLSPSIEYDTPAGQLASLVVDEAHRRAGVGRALVEAMEAEARRLGCGALFLTTAAHRAGAHAFYERLGFEHTGRRYAKVVASVEQRFEPDLPDVSD
jgi:N-acetylglutamate synthase-like GNAT family acetyltransferase